MSSGDGARVVLRTTAGKEIGFGHLRRCLTLARALAERGARPSFVVTGGTEAAGLAARAGFPVGEALDGDALVVDDYAVDAAGLARMRAHARRLVVIDDLAGRFLDADVVHNGNADGPRLAYRARAGCRMLLGPRYALLRPAFREQPRRRAGAEVRRVLVTLGGADPRGQTRGVVVALVERLPEATLDVVVGPLFGHDDALEALGSARVKLHRAPDELAPLMRAADLAVTAGGQTTYELAASGVPAVALCIADNQRGSLDALGDAGTLTIAADERAAGDAAFSLARDASRRQAMADAGQTLVDGRGVDRVAGEVLGALDA